jgi:hypothetical protein
MKNKKMGAIMGKSCKTREKSKKEKSARMGLHERANINRKDCNAGKNRASKLGVKI